MLKEVETIPKLTMMTTSSLLLGAAILAGSTIASAQTGTRGVGAPLTGVGPGTGQGGPQVRGDYNPPPAQTAPTHKRHVKRHHTKPSTVGKG